MYGIIDCDNCYVSCERVFRPDLKDKPVVVLSNNDGCVVARSNEAKKMGIKAGTPYFQLAEQFPNQKIVVFSSNYELYGELTSRGVMVFVFTIALALLFTPHMYSLGVTLGYILLAVGFYPSSLLEGEKPSHKEFATYQEFQDDIIRNYYL